MAKAGTQKTKAATAGGTAPARGTAAVLGRYLARQKTQSGIVAPAVAAPKPTPERAISIAIGRAAQKYCALSCFPVQARHGRSTLAEMIELLPERALVLVVENNRGSHGVVALSQEFLTAVIEMQSIGRVGSHPTPDRLPTRTDAAISAEFVNAALAELASELGLLGQGDGTTSFRFASFVQDPKPLELMLEDNVYDSYRLDARLGQGGPREGRFLAFLPAADQAFCPVDHPAEPAQMASAGHGGCSLSEAVQSVPITLTAILCRKSIPLRELRALTPGALIGLPFDAMAKARLETSSGVAVLTGKLGALHGQRAIRVTAKQTATTAAEGFASENADTVPQVADPAVGWDADPGISDADDTYNFPQTSLFAVEPPVDDMDDPDAFRPILQQPEPEEADNVAATALPMNFIID
ncbi:MAG: FliM/FliN family flagellar motor switch protein [Paracoccus denitrificans]|uniref:FliM/FliN family flagellar motor switch protein n=1 Tax=Paracoccus denitrificans TaxID=266 RepID=A0A533IDC0_PARDE|nr:MAG: FliM/FliN family flagellar motor switch protein [Paracoccus denitrificans]